MLLQAVVIVEATPFELLQLRQPTFEDECIGPILQTARQEATALKGLEAQLSKDYDLTFGTGMYTPPQLLEYAAVLDESSLWQRVFGGNYRRAVRAHHRIALGKKKPSRQQMVRRDKTGMELRMKEPYEKGVAIHSAPSFALGAVKHSVKRKQGEGRAGY